MTNQSAEVLPNNFFKSEPFDLLCIVNIHECLGTFNLGVFLHYFNALFLYIILHSNISA
jgi:hypothetical protein